MRMVLFRQVRGWSHGKLAVLDISETGKQIGEKLFILLDERQRILRNLFWEERKIKTILHIFHAGRLMLVPGKQISGCFLQKFMRAVYISVRNREKLLSVGRR